MKFVADREMLVEALSGVSGVIPNRTTLPTIQGVLVSASDAGASVEATDLEVWVRRRVLGVEASVPGAAVFPMPRLLDALKRCGGDVATVEVAEGGTASVRVGRSSFSVPTVAATLWPGPSGGPGEGDPGVTLRAGDLATAFARTEHAADPYSTSYALAGVQLVFDGAKVVAEAMDGRKVATQSLPAEGDPADWPTPPPVVPVRAAAAVRRVFGAGESVRIACDGQLVRFSAESGSVLSRLVQGRYPNWRMLLRGEPTGTARLDAGALLSLAERAAVFTTKESAGVDFRVGDGAIAAETSAPDAGRFDDAIDCETDGEPERFCLAADLFLSVLKPLDKAAALKLSTFGESESHVVLDTDDGFMGVVLKIGNQKKEGAAR